MAQALEAVAVLRQECRWYAKGVDELSHATGGRTVIIYECYDGSVVYFAPEALDFAEARELNGDEIVAVQRILDERGMPVGTPG